MKGRRFVLEFNVEEPVTKDELADRMAALLVAAKEAGADGPAVEEAEKALRDLGRRVPEASASRRL